MKRALIAVLVLILAIPLALLAAGETLLNTPTIRTHLLDAVQRATGHPLQLDGNLTLAWSLTPSVAIPGATLLNSPGYTRPTFATVRRIEAKAALLPLLSGRMEIPEVTIEGADILLERDAQGRGNWLPPPTPLATEPTSPSTPRPRTPVAIGRVTIQDSRVTWQGAPPIEIPRLAASPSGGPVEGQLSFRGTTFTLAGRTGPLDRAPTPIDLTAIGGGLALSVTGEAGATLTLQALIPDLAALQTLAARPLPPLKTVQIALQANPTGLQVLSLTAGPSDLAPALHLIKLDAKAAGLDQPLTITAEATLRTLPVILALNLGTPASLLAGGKLPFQAQLLSDGASLAAQGAADPASLTLDATITATIPDLRRTSALAGADLPPLHDAAINLRILPAPSGNAWLARGLRLTATEGDLSGDLAIGLQPRPSVRGTLQSQRLDLDALLAPTPPAPASPAPTAAPPQTPAPTPTAAAPPPLIPATPLPFATLRQADADLRLTAAQITWRAAPYRAAEARLLLQDGRLRLDPVQMQAPGGPLLAQLLADATATPPTAALTLRAAGLDAGALGGGPAVTGTLDLDVQLLAIGADLHSLATSAQGHAGAALIDGEVENQALANIFGPVLRAANLPAEAQGRSRLRCMAVRIDAAGGTARIAALAVDTTRLKLEGEGALNLVDDTLDMHLRPTIRIGPTGVAIPVRLTGPIRAPKPELERGAISPGRVGISIGGATPDPCPPALTAARDGRAGRMPGGTP